MGRLWRVVGGDKGGLLVRDGRELTSAEKAERLAKQSIVEEVEIAGPRLCYRICRGTGPETGWVSMKLKDKHLLVPADTRETGKRFSAETPLPELLCVQPSVKHGTERGALATLDELEQKAWAQVKETNSSMNSGKEALEDKMVRFKSTVQDLLHVAWKRENRKRVVLFLAKLLEFCSKNNWTRAAQILCHQLCLVSWASSMVDVEYYPFRDDAETNPMVLLCGFGGSHLDDLQPAIEQWTKRGAAVLAFGPALVGREDMLERIYEKLMEVLGGHPVILHFFSDGGFGMARSLLGMWNESWQHGQTRQSPAETIKCIISDGAGLLPHETTYIEDIQGGKGEPTTTTNTALAFFTGCGLNMLMTFGACQAFHEEPANSFGKTLIAWSNSGDLAHELTSAPRGPLASLAAIWCSPMLIVASRGDKVVPLERSLLLESWLRNLPTRQSLQEGKERDETRLYTLILEKALHCRAMATHAEEYWEAVDNLLAAGGVSCSG
ncbi:unnamed protein product [Durusdinium trenchii]|uniref:Uncharacterized protein n=1 Tax=Durusdinium trenchii TaxID=1381693 RepID=A0ABP0J7Y3_9DINO